MKKFLIWALLPVALPLIFSSCDDNNDTEEPTNYWVEYAEWRKGNQAFFEEKYAETLPDGTLKYDRVTPSWNAGATILMRWYNDRTLTQDAPKPLSTSYIDVVYKGINYEGEVFDDSSEHTAHGDSIYRTQLSQNIEGWVIALTNMHVGDKCEIIIPYNCAYKDQYKSDLLLPYSTLIFDVELRGIPGLEKPVKTPSAE